MTDVSDFVAGWLLGVASTCIFFLGLFLGLKFLGGFFS
jgi:hypothetical protein